MAIDFFLAACRESSNASVFGICDDPLPASNPAYLLEDHEEEWIAEVENENSSGGHIFMLLIIVCLFLNPMSLIEKKVAVMVY